MTGTNVAAAAAAGDLANLQGLKQAVAKTRSEVPDVGSKPFLKLEKTGNWVYGQQGVVVEAGSLWAINPLSFMHGYVCWTDYPKEAKKKNQNLGKVVVGLGKDKPEKANLAEYIDPDGWNNGQPWEWTTCISVELTCVSGEDEGVVVVYDTNSVSGVRLLSGYLDKLMAQLDKPDPTPVAVVTFGKDSYDHPQWGVTVVPEWNFVSWRALDDTTAPGAEPEAEPEPEAEAEAPNRRRRAAADQAAEAPEKASSGSEGDGPAPEPTRRGRRPAA